ncbi:MAG: hypothetical protein P8R42_12775 [Candidatus Binatia bacterium]|nr:hypothetical protein [Candidatus Binatia bacterium]
MRSGPLLISLLYLLFVPTLALAGEDCRRGGESYPSNVTICSGGLAVTCMNGSWQSNDGQRCDGPTGSYIGARRPLQEKNDEPIPEYIREENPGLDLR